MALLSASRGGAASSAAVALPQRNGLNAVRPAFCAPTLAARSLRCSILRVPTASQQPVSVSTDGAVTVATTAGEQPITVTLPAQTPGVLSPAANYESLLQVGVKKTKLPLNKLLVSGFLAGCYIGFGAYLACSIQGGLGGLSTTLPGFYKLVGALIFPVGLTLVVMSGAELYTGNTAVVTMALMEKKADIKGLVHNWFFSYLANFVGSLAMVAAVFATGTLVGNPVPVGLAETKCSLPFATAFVRAVLCNWLVCMAVWSASAASSLPGKLMGLWPPIAAFVAIGLEHSVANMFFIPLGIMLGAKVTFTEFLMNNLLPVTLGNTFAGVVFVACALGAVHGNLFNDDSKATPLPANN